MSAPPNTAAFPRPPTLIVVGVTPRTTAGVVVAVPPFPVVLDPPGLLPACADVEDAHATKTASATASALRLGVTACPAARARARGAGPGSGWRTRGRRPRPHPRGRRRPPSARA